MIVFNIMETLAALGRSREAMDALERFMAISNEENDAADRATALARRTVLLETLTQLTMSVEPSSATVEVDGVAEGGTGGTRVLYLDPGDHTILVRAEGFATKRETVVGVGGEASLAVWLEPLDASVVIRTGIPSSQITVDGEEVGRGEAQVEVAAGEHVIRVHAEGHDDYTRTIDVEPGARMTVDATFTQVEAPRRAYQSPILWAVVGVVAAGAAISVGILATRDNPVDGGTTGDVFAALGSW